MNPEAIKLIRRPHLTRRGFLRTASAAGVIAAGLLPARMRGLQVASEAQAATPIDDSGGNSLRSHAAAHGLLFGAAVNPALLDVDGAAAGKTTDPYTLLFATQASVLVAENSMKWGAIRPAPDKFDFTQGDRLVHFAGLNGQRVRGGQSRAPLTRAVARSGASAAGYPRQRHQPRSNRHAGHPEDGDV